MNRDTLKKAFREWKRATGADYAYTNVDRLGDCPNCVNTELGCLYGIDSTGIWAKHWNHGMNKDVPWEKCDSVYIAHDITESQADEIYNVFGKYYHVLPEKYIPHKCFELYEKSNTVYKVTYDDVWDGKSVTYEYYYADEEDAKRWYETLVKHKHDNPTMSVYAKAVVA